MDETETYISKISSKIHQTWIGDHLIFETRAGSFAYGVDVAGSDVDVRGVFIPPKEMLFPFQEREYIYGFGTQPIRYDMFDKIIDNVDVVYYSIIKYFDLLIQNNPNTMSFLFYNDENSTIYTPIIDRVNKNREVFLSKKIFTSYFGLANSCLANISKKPEKMHKNMYLGLRTLYELRDIVSDPNNVDFKRHQKILMSAKNGDIPVEEYITMFDALQLELSVLELKCDWRAYPDELTVRNLLWDCLEEYYGEM